MKSLKLRVYRKLAVLLAYILLLQTAFPTMSFALTSGPSQPEVQSFEPVGTSEMVDLFSGDFNYNIPLLEIGGYPINIAYHAGVTLEQEASWVGLGWNLNPGVINRNMRGIPDDFAGEEIKKTVDIKPNTSASLALGPSVELIGKELHLKASAGIRYNNYRGFDIASNLTIGHEISLLGAGTLTSNLSFDQFDGISFSPNLSLSGQLANKENTSIGANINIGAAYNSRIGLNELTFNKSHQLNIKNNTVSQGNHSGTLYTFNTPTYLTHAQTSKFSTSFSFDLKLGPEIPFVKFTTAAVGSLNTLHVQRERSWPAYGYLNSHLANYKSDLMDFNREKDGPFYFSSNELPIANFTYDSYSVTGQGVGGVYRPYRNQIGILSDPVTRSYDIGNSAGGFEIGFPASATSWAAGAHTSINVMNAYSGL